MQHHSAHKAHHGGDAKERHAGHPPHGGHYRRFLLMLLLSFACMYALMYAMVDRLANALLLRRKREIYCYLRTFSGFSR